MRKFTGNRVTKLAVALSLALPLAAVAQNPSTAPGTNAQRPAQSATDQGTTGAADTTKASRSDAKFMKEAAMGGMLEVELGRVAVQNAGSDQVKQFGQRMVDDHGKGNDELKALAQAEGVMLPTELDSKHAKEVQRMQKLTGADFDREYMKMMLEDHHKDIKAFEHEAQKGDDPEVKAFAAKTLPTLRSHLSMVEKTRSAMGAGAHNPESATRPEPSTGTSGQMQR
jgi:putative membrane protein